MYDIKRHRDTDSHKKFEKESKGVQSISNLFKRSEPSCDLTSQTTAAEVIMTDLIVNLNLPITAADKITKAVKKAFPDSKIAKEYQCGRSKSTAMIKCLAELTKEDLTVKMKEGPFTLSTDGSNDKKINSFLLSSPCQLPME